MASTQPPSDPNSLGQTLVEILSTLKGMKTDHAQLASSVEALQSRFDVANSLNQLRAEGTRGSVVNDSPSLDAVQLAKSADGSASPPTESALLVKAPSSPTAKKASTISRIILTTYPGQSGINPIPLEWGHEDYTKRGPIVVSRHHNTIRRRNAIGAHGGSYSIYHALAVASNHLDLGHKPDFTNTEPAVSIGPFPTWYGKKKIVAMDPFGHLAPWLFNDIIKDQDVDIRPTIAVTKAHMKIPELEQSVRAGD